MDYAEQRYYASSYGRFNTPDPARSSAKKTNPQSWNRYSYALGDPVNKNDPKGLCVHAGSDWWDDYDYRWNSRAETGVGEITYNGACRDLAEFCLDAQFGTFLNGYYYRSSGCTEENTAVQGGGGDGGGGGGSLSSNLTLLGDIHSELDRLLANPECAKIFGEAPGLLFGTSSTPTAANVLDSLINGSTGGAPSPYGSIQFVDPSDVGVANRMLGSSAAITLKNNAIRSFFGIASPSIVYVNNLDINDYFNTSANNAELTILHELGHVLSNLNWKGDQILADATNVQQSPINDALIKSKCGLH